MEKWDGDTSNGSPYLELRRGGLSHDAAVARIESGKAILNCSECITIGSCYECDGSGPKPS